MESAFCRQGGTRHRLGRRRRVEVGTTHRRLPGDRRERTEGSEAGGLMATISAAERLHAIPARHARTRAGWLAIGVVCLGGAAALGLFVGPVHLAPVDVFKKLISVLPFVRDT